MSDEVTDYYLCSASTDRRRIVAIAFVYDMDVYPIPLLVYEDFGLKTQTKKEVQRFEDLAALKQFAFETYQLAPDSWHASGRGQLNHSLLYELSGEGGQIRPAHARGYIGFEIERREGGDDVRISGDGAGLLSLANRLICLVQSASIDPFTHRHMPCEEGERELTIAVVSQELIKINRIDMAQELGDDNPRRVASVLPAIVTEWE